MKTLGFLLILVVCIGVTTTIIRSDTTAATTSHNARDQTPLPDPVIIVKPAPDRQQSPTYLRPSDAKGPFRLPVYPLRPTWDSPARR